MTVIVRVCKGTKLNDDGFLPSHLKIIDLLNYMYDNIVTGTCSKNHAAMHCVFFQVRWL